MKTSQNADLDRYLERARQQKAEIPVKVEKPALPFEERNRRFRKTALVFGAVCSLLFIGLLIIPNRLMLSGVPGSLSILGPLIGPFYALMIAFVFTLAAATSVKEQSRIIGAVLALIVLTLLGGFTLTSGSLFGGIAQTLAFAFLYSFPIAIGMLLLIPYGLLVRLAAWVQVKFFDRPWWFWLRAFPPAVLVVVTVCTAALFILTPAEAEAGQNVNHLVRQGLAVENEVDLPNTLRNMRGAPFLPYAQGRYAVEVFHNPLSTPVHFGGKPDPSDIPVTVKFETGFTFTCWSSITGARLHCENDWLPPEPTNPNDVSY